MFELQRVYAFAVTPQRRATEDDREQPIGGGIKLTDSIRAVLSAAFEKVDRGLLSSVDFDMEDNRSHPIRDGVLAVAFGATKTPVTAAARLALRLADTMDNRSHEALLVVAVEADDSKRRVSLLVFPREDVVQLGSSKRDEYLLEVLTNAFSTGSGLRKLARCDGHNSQTQFLSAEVLDLQLASTSKTTADFWITNFLKAKPRIDSKSGSRQLSAALQRAFDGAADNEHDAVMAAMFRASSVQLDRTSLASFAKAEIPVALQAQFLRGIPPEVARSVFKIDHQFVKESLGRRIITTQDGVIISAPSEMVGDVVEVKQRGSVRVVSYSGTIEKERVARARRAAEPSPAERKQSKGKR